MARLGDQSGVGAGRCIAIQHGKIPSSLSIPDWKALIWDPVEGMVWMWGWLTGVIQAVSTSELL